MVKGIQITKAANDALLNSFWLLDDSKQEARCLCAKGEFTEDQTVAIATLAVGVGCRRGATSSQISSAINDACRKIGRSSQSIAILASSIVKQEEIGLLAVVDQLEIPVKFYTNEELQDIIEVYRLGQSKFVLEEIGVGNVCEASALLGGRASNLLLTKTVYPKVTVALAEVKFRWWESDPAMA